MATAILRGPLALVAAVTAGLLPAPAAGAQVGGALARPVPLLADGVEATTGLPALRTDHAALPALAALDRVVLTGLAAPGGPPLDLELERVDLERLGFGFRVDGVEAPGLLDGLALSVWRGVVVGEPGSQAVLSFSARGVHGWVRAGGELLHLLPQPGPGGDWLQSRVLLARESDLASRGLQLGQFCGVAPPSEPVPVPPAPPGDGSPGGDCLMRTCSIAIETDFQLFQLFNDLGAETAYLTTLLAAVSDVYEQEIDTQLTFPYVQFYTTPSDPWLTPDGFGDMWDMLDEFLLAWAGDVPGGAVLAHYVSGAPLGGGLAYLGVLGDESNSYTFGVSADLHGLTPFPIAIDPLNWDFVVLAHELGHNFGAPHTHEMDPPVDTCGSRWDCEQGTIMSYCHASCGDMSAITPGFAPESAAIMLDLASAELPQTGPLHVAPAVIPETLSEAEPTLLTVAALVPLVGPVVLNYHTAVSAPYTTKTMTDVGGGTWATVIPAPLCDEVTEWYFSAVAGGCGPYDTEFFTAKTGTAVAVLHHDFETAAGWTGGAAGDTASAGLWTRGDPIGDGSAPHADMSPGGSDCWFTGQGAPGGAWGAADVDGGKTTLVSPLFDLSGGDAFISYWRWLSSNDEDLVDTLTVQISNDNGGSWASVETLTADAPIDDSFWARHEFQVSDFAPPTSQMRLRVVATDTGTDSLLEAAIDEFLVQRLECATTCQPDLGFGWPAGPAAADLSVCGGPLGNGTHAVLSLQGATPFGTATLFASLTSTPTPFKGGTLLPLPPLLLLAVPLNAAGGFTAKVPGGNGPVSLYLQAVYAAPGTAPANIGLSNAVRIDLKP